MPNQATSAQPQLFQFQPGHQPQLLNFQQPAHQFQFSHLLQPQPQQQQQQQQQPQPHPTSHQTLLNLNQAFLQNPTNPLAALQQQQLQQLQQQQQLAAALHAMPLGTNGIQYLPAHQFQALQQPQFIQLRPGGAAGFGAAAAPGIAPAAASLPASAQQQYIFNQPLYRILPQ